MKLSRRSFAVQPPGKDAAALTSEAGALSLAFEEHEVGWTWQGLLIAVGSTATGR